MYIGEYGKGVVYQTCTVNVDIFTCINFRGFMKMGNFACHFAFGVNQNFDMGASGMGGGGVTREGARPSLFLWKNLLCTVLARNQ